MAEKKNGEAAPKKKAAESPGIELPMQKIQSQDQSPSNLIIFSKPKVGKTSLLAELPNCLILDFEKGTKYVDALKMQVESVKDLKKIGKAILDQGKPYKYIAVDTVTALESVCIPYAEVLYSKTSMGKNWFKKSPKGGLSKDSGKAKYGNVLNLPNGAGYSYLRQALTNIIEFVKTLAPRVILLGHVKDVHLDKDDGTEFTSSDLDLTGKIKRIVSSQSDAIGYLYRGKENKNILTFKTTDDVSCGARPPHLRNKEIVISELKDDELITHWDKVYID